MHPQARAGVDFDNHAALIFQWPVDINGHDINAGDVQTDDLSGLDSPRGDFGIPVK